MTHANTDAVTAGSIIEYTVTDDHAVTNTTLGVGDTYPAMVTHVDDDTGVYELTVFLPNAAFASVTVDPNTPADSSKPDQGEANWKFDPMTGQPVGQTDPTPEEMGWKFDPETGKAYGGTDTADAGTSTDDVPPPPADTNPTTNTDGVSQ